jgi:hypothetical protein
MNEADNSRKNVSHGTPNLKKSTKASRFIPLDEVLILRAQGVKWKEVARILNERHVTGTGRN